MGTETFMLDLNETWKTRTMLDQEPQERLPAEFSGIVQSSDDSASYFQQPHRLMRRMGSFLLTRSITDRFGKNPKRANQKVKKVLKKSG